MKNTLRPYHISGAIFIAGAICLIIFTQSWIIGIIGLLIGYEIIDNGIKYEQKKTCKCNETKCCQGHSEDNHEPTVVGNDGERQGEDN